MKEGGRGGRYVQQCVRGRRVEKRGLLREEKVK